MEASLLDGIGGLGQLLDYGVSGAVVLAVLLGWLIPRWVHAQRVADKDEQIHNLRSALDKRDEQVSRLIEQGTTTIHLLEEIKTLAIQRRGAAR